MLQNIRSNIQGTFAKIIIGLIVISFSLFGIESLLLSGGTAGVAEVNGETITPFEVQQTANLQRRRLLSLLGEDADPALLDDDRLTRQAIDTLIQRQLLVQGARELGLMASEESIGRIVGAMEQFQVDGRFSPELFRSVLSGAGFTPALFKESLREDLLTNQLQAGLVATDFATELELELRARIAGEERDVRYLTIPLQRFDDAADVSEEAVQAWYDEHPEAFMQPESVDLSYIELTASDFEEPIAEERLREEFERTRDSFEVPTERRVAHILLIPDKDESDEAFAARVRNAREAVAGGEPFAAVAERLSDDVGSAAAGGDLGFTSGDAFPAPMEEALALLEVGEVSPPVRTDAGTHLIKLLERRDGKAVTFAEVRGEIENRLRAAAARDELIRAVEKLRDIAFNAEDLERPAQELGVPLARAEGVRRGQDGGLFSDPRLQSAIFSEDVLERRYNSEVIELSAERFLVLHVDSYRPPQRRPLDEVRATVAARIAEERARERARAEGEALLSALAGGRPLDALANAGAYDWQVELGARRGENDLPAPLRRRVFSLAAPGQDGAVRDLVQAPSGDVYVLELIRVRAGAAERLAAAEREALRRAIAGDYGAAIVDSYEERLRADADIEVY